MVVQLKRYDSMLIMLCFANDYDAYTLVGCGCIMLNLGGFLFARPVAFGTAGRLSTEISCLFCVPVLEHGTSVRQRGIAQPSYRFARVVSNVSRGFVYLPVSTSYHMGYAIRCWSVCWSFLELDYALSF